VRVVYWLLLLIVMAVVMLQSGCTMSFLKRAISCIGWIFLLSLVYMAVIVGLIIREFPGDDSTTD